MSLDLGALFGTVGLDTVPFDQAYTRTVGRMRILATEAQKASGGVRILDTSLAAAGRSSTTAAAGIDRTTRASTAAAAADEKAAAAASRHAQAVARVGATMGLLSGATQREQAAVLRAMAAQERYDALLASGTATTRQLALAQGALLTAQRSVTAAQQAAIVEQERLNAAQLRGAAAATGARGSLAGLGRTAVELGLLIGGIELVRKTAEFLGAGKELTDALNSVQAAAQATDHEMIAVRAQAIALGQDLTVPAATAVDAAEAIDDLVRAGMTLPRALASAKAALLLISVTNTDAAFSARVLGDALDEFMLPASEATNVATMLAAAATSTAGGLRTVFDALKYSGSRARAADIPLSDLLATIVDLSKAGLQGTMIGTGLAMAISKLASPSGPGAVALKDLGIEAWTAGGRFKGLANIVSQVYDARKRFGSDSERFLKDISVLFGARAANAIAAFSGKGIEGLDRFQERLESFDLQKAADQMNRGVGAGFRQLGKEATAAGIAVYQDLEPPLATAVMWLGTNLPHAVSTLAAILGPTVHLVGEGLGGAWTVVSAILAVAGGALSAVAGFLEENKALVTGVATAVLSMWAAFKLYKAAQLGILAVRLAMVGLGDRVRGMGASMAAAITPANIAIAGIGIAIAGAVYEWQRHKQIVEAWKAETAADVTEIVGTLDDLTGAITKTTTTWIQLKLVSLGVYDALGELGLSFDTITSAAEGNAAALKKVDAVAGDLDALDARSASTWYYGQKVHQLAEATGIAQHQLRQFNEVQHKSADVSQEHARALQWVVDAHGRLIQVEAESKSKTDAATSALEAQTRASTLLKQALDLLNGVNESVETSTNAFQIALGGVRNKTSLATDKNGDYVRSLKQNTVAGAQNRNTLVQLIDTAKAQAQSVTDQVNKHHSLTEALRAGRAALKTNEAAIRDAAQAAGLDKDEVNDLIASLGKLGKLHPKPDVDVDTGPAMLSIAAVDREIGDLTQTVPIYLRPSFLAANDLPGRASGGGLPMGFSAVGEAGAELVYNDGGGHPHVFSHGQSRQILNLTGMNAPGFAGGTGGKIDYQQVGKDFRGDVRTLGKLGLSLDSSRSDIARQLRQVMHDLAAAGAPREWIRSLTAENRHILDAVKSRNHAATMLAEAHERLAAARRRLREDRSSFRGAVVGSFDITSDGADPVTGKITGGSMLAAQRQAVTRAKLFVADLKKLIGKKVFPGAYIRQLAGKGPDALPEVQALMSLSPSELRTLAADNRELNRLGRSIGGIAANRLDRGAIDAAQASVATWREREQRRQQHLDHTLDRLANRLEHKLDDLHLEGRLGLTEGQLSVIVDTGRKHQRHHRHRPGTGG